MIHDGWVDECALSSFNKSGNTSTVENKLVAAFTEAKAQMLAYTAHDRKHTTMKGEGRLIFMSFMREHWLI